MQKKKAKGHGHGHHKKTKGNPGGRHHHHGGRAGMHKKRYKRNPSLAGFGPAVTNAVFVIVGALGSKLGAQAVLGSKNVGVIGYLGNAGAGAVLWFLADKVMKWHNAAAGILAGTLVQIILRAVNDATPFGQYINNLGMGDYQMQSFVTPQVLVDPVNSAEIAIPPAWQPAPAPALPPMAATAAAGGGKGVSGLYSSFGRRGLY